MSGHDLLRARRRKNARSSPNGACVDDAVVWRKSSRSSANSHCVEVASVDRTIAVRDSKDPAGPQLGFTQREWDTFVRAVKRRDSA